MYKSKRQLYLEKELKREKCKSVEKRIKEDNNNTIEVASYFRDKLVKNSTKAEKKLLDALSKSSLWDRFVFQHIIYIKKKTKIRKFYITDFCFPEEKLIIELDGEYHYTSEQYKKDKQRTEDLNRQGYRLYRIDNNKILSQNSLESLIDEIIKLL